MNDNLNLFVDYKKIIVVGDTTSDLAKFAESYNAVLVDQNNIDWAISTAGSYYVSLGDVGLEKGIDFLGTADIVILQPKQKWQDQKLLKTTLYVCRSFSHRMIVNNLDFYNTDFSYAPTYNGWSNQNRLWLFGGSLVAGEELIDRDKQKFGTLLGELLNVDQIIDTSRGGSSMRRALEILVNSNVGPNDYVVLDPTNMGRLRLLENNQVVDKRLADCGKNLILATTDDQMFYDFVSQVDNFIKICKLAKTKFLFFSWQSYNEKTLDCYNYFSQYPTWSLEALKLLSYPLDRGLDNQHPGPKTHAKLANVLYQDFLSLYGNNV